MFRIKTLFWWESHPRGPRLSSMAMAPEDQRMDGPTEDPPVELPPACNCPRCRGTTVQEWSQKERNDWNHACPWSAQQWAEWEAYKEKCWANFMMLSQPQSRMQETFEMDHFRSFAIFTAHYSQHNIALKWFSESTAAIGQTSVVCFPNDAPLWVPNIVDTRGGGHTFQTELRSPWRWQEMVAQLDYRSLQFVVQGPQNRSRGIVECKLKMTCKDHHMRQGKLVDVWDFVLMREDGSFVYLHPRYNRQNVDCSCPTWKRTRKNVTLKNIENNLKFDTIHKGPQSRSEARMAAPPQSRSNPASTAAAATPAAATPAATVAAPTAAAATIRVRRVRWINFRPSAP